MFIGGPLLVLCVFLNNIINMEKEGPLCQLIDQ